MSKYDGVVSNDYYSFEGSTNFYFRTVNTTPVLLNTWPTAVSTTNESATVGIHTVYLTLGGSNDGYCIYKYQLDITNNGRSRSGVTVYTPSAALNAAIQLSPVLAPMKPNLSAQTLSFTLRNPAENSALTLGTARIEGDIHDEFTADTSACTTLASDASCTVTVTYTPVSGASGQRSAMLILPDTNGTVLASALLTSNEGVTNQAARRLPDVLSQLSFTQNGAAVTTLQSGVPATVSWSQTGYQTGMESLLAVFECDQTTLNAGNCGSSYDTQTQNSEFKSATSSAESSWSYQGTPAQVNNYSWTFTPDCTGNALVLRFYQRSALDKTADNTSLSVLAPGGLLPTANYYDQEGRRLSLSCSSN